MTNDTGTMTRYLRPFLEAAAVLLLGVTLLVTIHFTLFELQWIAFLAGVLFAAVAALASQTAEARRLLARGAKRLERAKQALMGEHERRRHAVQAQKAAEACFEYVNDALPVRIVFVDRGERCQYHNRAFARWRSRNRDQITGHSLHEVLGDEIYQELKSHSADVFTGKGIRYQTERPQPGNPSEIFTVTLLPYPPDAQLPSGFYVLIAGAARSASQHIAAVPAEPPAEVLIGPDSSGEALYLQSITEQLISGKDPRAKLVQALQEDQFILFAQSIKPLASGGPWPRLFEVLLRLQEEEEYMAPPGGFIPVAERHNMMVDIDRWVVRNLIKWCLEKQRSDAAWTMPLYCVNLAGVSVFDSEFALYVRSEVQRTKFPAENLCFELAESDVINNYAAVQAFMNVLKPLGCRFTLDAFGSTKVSFTPFKGLPLDFLKIDGIIIQSLMKDPTELAKTRAIVQAAKQIGVYTIAEFVETDETIAKLREIGIDYAQGFGIGKSGPIAQMS